MILENFIDILANMNWFETFNYRVDNRYGIVPSPSAIGKMKNEYSGKIIRRFYGTGAKPYDVETENGSTKKPNVDVNDLSVEN